MYITCIYIKHTEDEINVHALMQMNRKETKSPYYQPLRPTLRARNILHLRWRCYFLRNVPTF